MCQQTVAEDRRKRHIAATDAITYAAHKRQCKHRQNQKRFAEVTPHVARAPVTCSALREVLLESAAAAPVAQGELRLVAAHAYWLNNVNGTIDNADQRITEDKYGGMHTRYFPSCGSSLRARDVVLALYQTSYPVLDSSCSGRGTRVLRFLHSEYT
jgi:hypothetical protein